MPPLSSRSFRDVCPLEKSVLCSLEIHDIEITVVNLFVYLLCF